MSEIRDRAKALIVQKLDILATSNLIDRGTKSRWNYEDILAEEILSIPELAIVDREAELPDTSNDTKMSPEQASYYLMGYEDCKQICNIGGWVKEIDPKELCTLIP